MNVKEKITRTLGWFVSELNEPDEHYISISSGIYRWATIRRKNTNDIVMTFRGHTYEDLYANIEYAWSAHCTMMRGF